MKNRILIIVILLNLSFVTVAQTVNVGEIYISTDTQFSSVDSFNNTTGAILINDGEVFVYKHFNNDGVVDYSNTGIVSFTGNSQQIISGNNTSYFYNVLFDNTTSLEPAFNLSGDISIANESDFNTGVVDNDNDGGTFIFEQQAYHVNTTDESHVDGKVIKIGDTSFSYPIGDSGFYRYAEISAPDNSADSFTGQYTFENANDLYPYDRISGVIEIIDTQEYWTITNDGSSSNILLTLSWEEGSTTPQEVVANPQSAIHIVRWDEEQQLWLDEGGVVDASNKTVTTPLLLEDYGVFTLARVKENLILPGDVVVYNGVSPNGDGDNDYFFIDNIQNLSNNKVEVYNRWGIKVFSTHDYDTSGNVFEGYSDARLTLGYGLLPSGTYFYILEYDYTNEVSSQRIKQAGYLYLNTD